MQERKTGRMTGLWAALDRTNRILLFVIAALGVVLLGCLWLIARLSLSREVTVHIPPGVYHGTSVVIGNNKGYVMLWGRDFLRTMTEYSPNNYEAKANYLLSYASTAGEKNIRPRLLQEYAEVKRNNAYQEFHANENSWKATWLTRTLWRVEVEGDAVRESPVFRDSEAKRIRRCVYYVDITYDKDGIRLEDFGYVEK